LQQHFIQNWQEIPLCTNLLCKWLVNQNL